LKRSNESGLGSSALQIIGSKRANGAVSVFLKPHTIGDKDEAVFHGSGITANTQSLAIINATKFLFVAEEAAYPDVGAFTTNPFRTNGSLCLKTMFTFFFFRAQ
jgi:hypothetical protein